jgi:hypothetical protein
MGRNSSWLLIHSTAPAQPIALETSPSAAAKSPMLELCCLTSGVVSLPSAVNSVIVQPDSKTCILEIPILPQLSIVQGEKYSRSIAHAGTAPFERPQWATVRITQDRIDGPMRVSDGQYRVGQADLGNCSGHIVRHSAAGRHAYDIATRYAINTAGRHSARFNRNGHTRRQSGRSFAKCAHGDLFRF